MKSYTDLEQSKKLAEILPLNTADMCYILHASSDNLNWRFDNDWPPMVLDSILIEEITGETLPCWSLAALLNNIPQVKLDSIKQYDKKHWRCCAYFASDWHNSDWCNNPVDACYEMILKLHELKML